MSRPLPLIVCLLLVIAMATSCNSQKEEAATEEAATVEISTSLYATMQKHKIEYVGDNSGVAKLLSFYPETEDGYVQKMFSLQTETEPYGLYVYFEPGDNWNGAPMKSTDELGDFLSGLGACIGNLGYVEFRYRTTDSGGVLNEEDYKVVTSWTRMNIGQ